MVFSYLLLIYYFIMFKLMKTKIMHMSILVLSIGLVSSIFAAVPHLQEGITTKMMERINYQIKLVGKLKILFK